MSRIAVPAREAAPAASQPLLDAVEKQLGVVPNLFRLVALSPAALQGFLGLNGALWARPWTSGRANASPSPSPRSMVATTASPPHLPRP